MTNSTVPVISPDATPITIVDAWAALFSHKFLILAGTSVAGALAAAISWMMPPIYRAEVLLMPVTHRDASTLPEMSSPLGGLAALAGLSIPSSQKEEALATLQSRLLTETFIREKNLLPVLFARMWDPATSSWKVEERKVPSVWDGYALFSKKIRRVIENRKTGLVSLTIDWADKHLAAAWAAELVARTNQMLRQRAIEHSTRNIKYIEEQLGTVSIVEMRQALYRLLETEYKNIMLAQGTEEYAFKTIDPAVVPERKHKPHRIAISLLGAALGFFVSIIAAFALHFRSL